MTHSGVTLSGMEGWRSVLPWGSGPCKVSSLSVTQNGRAAAYVTRYVRDTHNSHQTLKSVFSKEMENQKCVRELGLVPGTCTEGTGQQDFASQQARRHELGQRGFKGLRSQRAVQTRGQTSLCLLRFAR